MDRESVKALVRAALRDRMGPAESSSPVASQANSPVGGKGPGTKGAPKNHVGGRVVITEREVLGFPRSSSVPLPANALVTPLARETAERLGIHFVTEAATAEVPSRPAEKKTENPTTSAPNPVKAVVSPANEVAGGSSLRGVVALGADHGGFALKVALKTFLEKEAGYAVLDLGPSSNEPVDYPDFAHRVAGAVSRGEAQCGIMIDGVGIGSCMAANRHPKVRAAAASGILEVVNAREHNDANVLCLGGRMVGDMLARALVVVFLTTPFGGGRHARRVEKIESGAPSRGDR